MRDGGWLSVPILLQVASMSAANQSSKMYVIMLARSTMMTTMLMMMMVFIRVVNWFVGMRRLKMTNTNFIYIYMPHAYILTAAAIFAILCYNFCFFFCYFYIKFTSPSNNITFRSNNINILVSNFFFL